MTKPWVLGLSLLALAALALLIVALPFSRKAVFCSEIIMPYELIGNNVVFVPRGEHDGYNRAFLAFVRKRGLWAGSEDMSLSEVGGSGAIYRSLYSSACDGFTYVASHNVVHPDEFIVTFHSNWLMRQDKAAAMERAFLAEFGARYRIRPEREVNRERGF
jgi:hypothetical protein